MKGTTSQVARGCVVIVLPARQSSTLAAGRRTVGSLTDSALLQPSDIAAKRHDRGTIEAQ